MKNHVRGVNAVVIVRDQTDLISEAKPTHTTPQVEIAP